MTILDYFQWLFLVRIIFIELFIYLFIPWSGLQSEIIKKIEVKGNERISLETLAIFGDLKLGQDYEAEDINLLIKKLYETNFFSNISIELDNNKLTITVEENPIINTITFSGEKADKYRDAINELLNLREKNSYVKGLVKSDINILKCNKCNNHFFLNSI